MFVSHLQRSRSLLARAAFSMKRENHRHPTRRCRSSLPIAITRDLPDSFGDALVEHYASTTSSQVSLAVAKAQHDEYVKAMREAGMTTLSLPAAANLPDSVFVEDTAIVIRCDNGDDDNTATTKAIILQPGHENRQAEVHDIRTILHRLLPAENIFEMADLDQHARCDGGDVLYTGRHLFVGLTERTNREALHVLEGVWDGIPLVPVAMPPHAPVLHLKSAVTHMDATTLVAPAAPWANGLVRSMRATALGYTVIRIPDVLACNMVVLPGVDASSSSGSDSNDNNGVLLLQDTPCPESRAALEQVANERQLSYKWVNTAELAKKDAALTCCSIFVP